jgi:SnoaL-like domain
MLSETEEAELHIRRLVELWALSRDAGDWESFASVWHDDGWMTATWFQGPAADFIAASRAGFDAGVSILHFLGGSRCQVAGHRAPANPPPARRPRPARPYRLRRRLWPPRPGG